MAVVAQILPIFQVGEEPGKGGGTKKSSPSGTIGSDSGPTGEVAIPSPAVADNDDADMPTARGGETATPSPSPEAQYTEAESPVPFAEASQPANDVAGGRDFDEAVRTTEEMPASDAILTEDCGQSAGVGGDNDAGGVPTETRERQTSQEVEAAGEQSKDFPPQTYTESLSGTRAEWASRDRPGSAGDNNSSTKKRESRAELGRGRSASKMSRKTIKRSASMASRRSGGGGKAAGGEKEPPANTPHLQV